MKVVDLSVPLAEDVPCWWPELAPFAATNTLSLSVDNVFSRSLLLEEHCGTHMDAPSHVGDAEHRPIDDRTSDAIPLSHMIGRARVLDARMVRGHDPGISPAVGVDILAREESQNGRLSRGEVAIIWTGWSDDRYESFPAGDRYVARPLAKLEPGWPAPGIDLIDALGERGITALAIDVPTIGALPDTLLAHRAAFKANVTPIENLTNIAAIAGREAMFVFLPLRIASSSGAPGRAIAILADETT